MASNRHFLAQARDISRGLTDTLATVVVLIQLISESLEHGRISVSGCRPGSLLGISIPVSLESRHIFCHVWIPDCCVGIPLEDCVRVLTANERVVQGVEYLAQPRILVGQKLLARWAFRYAATFPRLDTRDFQCRSRIGQVMLVSRPVPMLTPRTS